MLLFFFFFRFFANFFSAFVIGLFVPILVENFQYVGAAAQCTADTLYCRVTVFALYGLYTYYTNIILYNGVNCDQLSLKQNLIFEI